MTEEVKLPFTEKELTVYLDYLDGLRESAITNMCGAAPYMQDEFGLNKYEARAVLSHWRKTFPRK